MKLSVFSKAIVKDSNPKQVKLALKQLAKNTLHTNLMTHTIALHTSTGDMIQVLTPYILGEQFSGVDKKELFATMGDVGAHLVGLAKLLKVKMPTPTKKSRLVGTRTAALLEFNSLTRTLLQLESSFIEDVPVQTIERKGKSPEGTTTVRELTSISKGVWVAREEQAQATMAAILAKLVALYWSLCFDMLGHPPQPIFDAVAEHLTPHVPVAA